MGGQIEEQGYEPDQETDPQQGGQGSGEKDPLQHDGESNQEPIGGEVWGFHD